MHFLCLEGYMGKIILKLRKLNFFTPKRLLNLQDTFLCFVGQWGKEIVTHRLFSPSNLIVMVLIQ